MYTYEQRMKALKLYIKYEHRAKAVSRELGYPHSNFLVRWYKEYLKNRDLKVGYHRDEKYSQEQKQYALQYYAEHGRCTSQTGRNLGYPSPHVFRKCLDEAYPDCNCGRTPEGAIVEYSQEEKEQAVINLCARTGLTTEVADIHGVSPVTLYEWKKQLLGTRGSTSMPYKKNHLRIQRTRLRKNCWISFLH